MKVDFGQPYVSVIVSSMMGSTVLIAAHTFISLVILASSTGALTLVGGMIAPIFWVAVFTASAEASNGCAGGTGTQEHRMLNQSGGTPFMPEERQSAEASSGCSVRTQGETQDGEDVHAAGRDACSIMEARNRQDNCGWLGAGVCVSG